MKGAVLILRPQPGADETARRAEARDLEAVVAPLFRVHPTPWSLNDVNGVEAVLFTSANAARHGGAGLSALTHLPCYAVGEATALAAGEAGFRDVRIGPSDGAAVVRMMAADGIRRALHPRGVDSTPLPDAGVELVEAIVYEARALDRLPDEAIAAINAGAIVLLHSPRAAALFSEQVGERRADTSIAAISEATAEAGGDGWASVAVAVDPRDDALILAAEALAERRRRRAAAPPPPAPPPVAPETTPARPVRRSWLGTLLLLLVAFLLGMAALFWVLNEWEAAGRLLGLTPPAAAPAPNPQLAPSPSLPQPQPQMPAQPQADRGTLIIDPDVARRVAALEQRIGELNLDTRNAVGNADRAEGLLVAFAVRRALDRGIGLGYLEGLLRNRFGQTQPQAVGTILAVARDPVTLEGLQLQLAELGPQMTGAAPDQSFFDALRGEFSNLVIIRREGTPSTDPRERLRRAVARLEAGQVEVALTEVLRLPGRENGRAWIDAAQRYVAARRALDRIEGAALLEPRMPPPQPAALPAPAP
jgi:uroporphyrinogen-III synthase